MESVRRLVIDIGTNSVLALLADVSDERMEVIFDRQKTTRLGEDLSRTGRLSDDAMARTVEVIGSFVENAKFNSAFLVGTEALRVASNSSEFVDLAQQKTGYRPAVISGRQEAEFTFRGALFGLEPITGIITAADVGGGSTEIIRANRNSIIDAESIPLGALKLKESVAADRLSEYREYADEFISDRDILNSRASDGVMIGIGGTITSIAAVALGLEEFESRAVHGCRISASEIESIAARFEGVSGKERQELIPFDPQRADLILPGAGIFLAVMGIIKVNDLIVSARGLRFGVALYPEKML
jgi:exopolyphosphatase/guanosine-5'-triphosphate,3'-diphosphate pyrophosphatase